MRYAVTREVSPAVGRCERVHLEREPIDLARARAQHAAYRQLLIELGWTVINLPAYAELADSVFVEDAAVVTDEVAIIMRPGAPSRRAETAAVSEVLRRFREVVSVEAPATVDGGDVLRVGRRVWVGLTSRTNEAGVDQLRRILEPHDYVVAGVPVSGCLHLKSAATVVGPGCVIVNARWIDPGVFDGLEVLEVDPAEPPAANVLFLDDVVVVALAYPRTRERIERRGAACRAIDASELAKAEGALTCCSILFEA